MINTCIKYVLCAFFAAHALNTQDILLRISFYLSLQYKQNKQPIEKRHPRGLFAKLIKKNKR